MTSQLSAFLDAIADGATEPLNAQERTQRFACFAEAFPQLTALLSPAV